MMQGMRMEGGGDRDSNLDSRDDPKRELYRTSASLFYGSLCAFGGGLLLVMSFASPYWLVSWEDTMSPFQNMGLWEFCFYHFRHPDYQFDHLFHGCHPLYGDEYRLIREKLLPGWLMVVQLFVTLALIFSFSGLLVAIVLLLRYPLEVALRFEYHFCSFITACYMLSAFCLFLSVAIFGIYCWDRNWLLYPNFNYLSWSYMFATLACLAFLLAGLLMLKDYYRAREKKERNKALIMQMHPPDLQLSSNYHLGGGSGFI